MEDQPETSDQFISKDQFASEDYDDLNAIFESQDISGELYQYIENDSYENSCEKELYSDWYEDSCEEESYNDRYEDSCEEESHDQYENSYEDNETDDSILKEIYSGQTFGTFELLEKCLKRFANQKGFEIRTVRAEKDNGKWARKTYKCHHGKKYIPKKKIDPTQTRDRESICIDCDFMLQNQDSLQEFSPSLRKIPDHIMNEIQFYVQECQLGATVLKKILRNKYPTQAIYRQDLYNAIQKFKANAQVKNDAATLLEHLIQLYSEDPESYFKVDFENEAKYSRWQEFRNMNPTTGVPRVSNTIFKSIDEIFEKYLTPNSLAVQRRQIVESLLYRVEIKELDDIILQGLDQYNIGFLEDDYEEPQILISMALENCSEKNEQEESIWLIQTEAKLQTGTFQTLNNIRGQEISNKYSISSNSRKDLYGHERLLQQFIEQQFNEKQNTFNLQNDNLTELPENTNSIYNITDPLQHKGRGRPANKRYLSAIENQSSKEKKKNKRQCSICKSWYHDSRNCPVKVSQHNKENN
ncbi:8344_t:CDS:2 [Dentiscutata erythropus]|uniref:8344_t:CDS:1 n=1 Tax=Dentiscutata erythropus TaxID=1348616 RepID=A0A9N8W8C0_9GLOM|nr:8344_t:CDS:2 [Dentiscutata erythropus]